MNYVVYGLQRSGTNFLEELIKKSYTHVDILNAYEYNAPWKHAFDIHYDIVTSRARVRMENGEARPFKSKHPYVVKDYDYWINRLREVNAILIHKHPFTWIDSVTRKPVDTHRFKLFNANKEPAMFAHIYRAHYEFWKEQRQSQPIYKVKYEDLIIHERTFEIVKEIGQFFNDSYNGNETLPNKVGMSERFDDTKRMRYINVHTNLSEEIQHQVREIIGDEVFKDYGYE